MLRTRVVPALLAVLLVLAAVATRVATRHEAADPDGRAGHDPSDWFYAQRAGRDGEIPQARYAAALEQVRFERALAARAATTTATAAPVWTPVGPYNIGGRVTALAVAPGGTTLYLGAADGGVWKSTNSGVDWACVSDGAGLASIGALAIDPQAPTTIWCGTGESNGSVDSYDGNGLWVSTDAGASWNLAGLASTGRIARVWVDPANSSHLLVAAMGHQFSTSPDRGLYQTTDAGATWAKVLYVSDSTGVTDVVMNPVHPDTLYCATWERLRRPTYRRASGPESGIWKSVDRGTTWTRLANGLPATTDSTVGRIALAVAPSRPSTVYASIGTGYYQGYVGYGFYRSTDGGATWLRRDSGTTFTNNFGGFCWYFGDIAADPTNADHVWSLGVSLYSTTNGGANWSSVNGTLHPDQHAIWVDPTNASHLYEGNDGGFWWSTTGSTWSHSANLPISQFYDGDVDASNVHNVFGGLQDNSTIKTTTGPSGWFTILGGDGFHVLVDPVAPNVALFEYQYCCSGSGFVRSTSAGVTDSVTTGWNSSDRFGWDTPIAMNPRNHNVLIAGSQYVYRSTNNGITWAKPSAQDLSTNPTSQLVYGCCTTVAISAADTNVYYAGTDDGKVWRSNNRGAAWTDVSAGLPGRWVTRIVPDPVDAQAVYVTESGFSADVGATMIYRSSNQGATWTNISANLPNLPADVLVVDPNDTNTLYLGTDLGVFITRTQGGYWQPLGVGLPLQAIDDLKLHAASRQLFAFTHGRSVWSLDLTALPVAVPAGAPPLLALSAPAPNPTRGATTLRLALPAAARVDAAVFDAAGRRVATLAAGALAAGTHALAWDGHDARGRAATAGVYFVRVEAAGGARTQRVVMAR